MKNRKIRETAKNKGVYLWEIALALKISEATLTRKLRKELSTEETDNIINIIEQLSAEKA